MAAAPPSETSSISDSYWISDERPSKEDVRTFEQVMADARSNLGYRELEISLQQFTSALRMTEEHADLAHHKYEVLGNLGWIERLRCRYANAAKTFNEALALADAPPIAGELGTVYRQTGKLGEAQKYLSKQYNQANKLRLKGSMCRAIGNLGAISYQQALKLHLDRSLSTNNPSFCFLSTHYM